MGLAWTALGGATLYIETANHRPLSQADDSVVHTGIFPIRSSHSIEHHFLMLLSR